MSQTTSTFLSLEFLAQYKDKRPKNAGVLFEITHLNKYAWWLEDELRRETWEETCRRVVNYNVGLYQGPASLKELVKEAELMFDKLFNLEAFCAGRTLRIGGTKAAEKFPEMNFNCAFITIDTYKALVDLFHMSLCSVGIGFRTLLEDIEEFELFLPEVAIQHMKYYPNSGGVEYTTCEFKGYQGKFPTYYITIGDSKEGWVKALDAFLTLCHSVDGSCIKFVFDYSQVRRSGERIHTAGGFAAGPEGLVEMFDRLAELITKKQGIFEPIDALDSSNLIAKNVTTGGNRRAAQINLMSPKDKESIRAKQNIYKRLESGKWIPDPGLEHRKMSNNSITYTSKPELQELQEVFELIKTNGEPGFFNLEAARKRRPNCQGLNPCAEILLDSKGVCNLSTVVMPVHIKDGALIELGRLQESVRLATRIGMRQTNVTLSLPDWDRVQKRDRLTGVSLTGWGDFCRAVGWEWDVELHPSGPAAMLLRQMSSWANNEADKYAYEMRIPRPLLVTAVKPEGTISQLPTVSSGLHKAFAPYYIRRMTVSKNDPLNTALKTIGVPWELDIRQEKSSRDIFVFPVETGAKECAYDEPAIQQLKRYIMMQNTYTDHNSSCTIYVGSGTDGYRDEWEEVLSFVYENWDQIVAVSFLPKHSLDNPPFPQMPYESISKGEYEEMMMDFPDLSNLGEELRKYEFHKQEYEEVADGCAGNVCPAA